MKKVAIAIVVIVGVVIVGVLVIVLFTPTPVTWIISPFTSTPGYYPDLSISMGITGGWCVCDKQWEIDGDGNVSYELSGPSVVYWSSSAKLTPQQVEELVAAIKQANLWALKDRYSIGWILCGDCSKVDLSITFNGWSKHISYYDGFCARQEGPGMDPAPQAVCDLQDKIEAIERDRLAMPTPGPWPTATPAPPPTPTSPPPPFMAAGDFGILSQEPCGPPCFLGIRPGVTTFEEAALILQNVGVPCETITPGKSLSCQSGSTLISVSGERTVDRIDLAPPTRITLSEFIAQYGAPDSLMLYEQRAVFYYDRLETLIFLPRQLGRSYTVGPGTTISGAENSGVEYLAAIAYQEQLLSAEKDRQPWHGYGTYTPKTSP